jgi:hypothetical protein
MTPSLPWAIVCSDCGALTSLLAASTPASRSFSALFGDRADPTTV